MENYSGLIKEGDYVIVKKQSYSKLHQLSSKPSIMLGKDKLDLSLVIGKPAWTLYRMIPKKNSKREFGLEVCEKAINVSDKLMKDVSSGIDNRTIVNDNKSQLLSSDDITGMRDNGLSPSNIVTALIENSTTFRNKTEYSQVKYLKKKEKKYHEYVTVIRPTVRLLSELFFSRDQYKVLGLRFDTLSQMLTALNIQPGGVYLIYESGTQGLVAASVLNYCRHDTYIINMSLGIHPQRQAVLAMNYSKDILECILNVKVSSFLELLNGNGSLKEEGLETKSEASEEKNVTSEENSKIESSTRSEDIHKKRKSEGEPNDANYQPNGSTVKRARWADELELAKKLLLEKGVDGFVIACKEYPAGLIDSFCKYMKASRSLVIYSVYREPLVDLYCALKKKKYFINAHLTESWLRHYQVLPERTHPLVSMSPSGGFLLTATTVEMS